MGGLMPVHAANMGPLVPGLARVSVAEAAGALGLLNQRNGGVRPAGVRGVMMGGLREGMWRRSSRTSQIDRGPAAGYYSTVEVLYLSFVIFDSNKGATCRCLLI